MHKDGILISKFWGDRVEVEDDSISKKEDEVTFQLVTKKKGRPPKNKKPLRR